jgi:glutaconate CoA-transferase subunit A
VPTADLLAAGPVQSLLLNRMMTDGVVETPHGAHFTSCVPDYDRDEAFQREYAASAASPEAWEAFRARYLDMDEPHYQDSVASRREAVS